MSAAAGSIQNASICLALSFPALLTEYIFALPYTIHEQHTHGLAFLRMFAQAPHGPKNRLHAEREHYKCIIEDRDNGHSLFVCKPRKNSPSSDLYLLTTKYGSISHYVCTPRTGDAFHRPFFYNRNTLCIALQKEDIDSYQIGVSYEVDRPSPVARIYYA